MKLLREKIEKPAPELEGDISGVLREVNTTGALVLPEEPTLASVQARLDREAQSISFFRSVAQGLFNVVKILFADLDLVFFALLSILCLFVAIRILLP